MVIHVTLEFLNVELPGRSVSLERTIKVHNQNSMFCAGVFSERPGADQPSLDFKTTLK